MIIPYCHIWYILSNPEVYLALMHYFQVCYKFVWTTGVHFERFFEPKFLVKSVRFREVSALERLQLQRD